MPIPVIPKTAADTGIYNANAVFCRTFLLTGFLPILEHPLIAADTPLAIPRHFTPTAPQCRNVAPLAD